VTSDQRLASRTLIIPKRGQEWAAAAMLPRRCRFALDATLVLIATVFGAVGIRVVGNAWTSVMTGGCLQSIVRTRGAICVPDSTWERMLLGDRDSWGAQNSDKLSGDGTLNSTSAGGREARTADNSTWTRLRIAYLQNKLLPTLSCPELSYVGTPTEGGNYVCNIQRLASLGRSLHLPKRRRDQGIQFHEDCLVYSFGPRNSQSLGFEKSLPINCETHIFDHTAKGKLSTAEQTNMFHHNLSIASLSEYSVSSTTLTSRQLLFVQIQLLLEHSHRVVTLLKVDVANQSEFDILPEILKTRSPPPEQIILHVHLSPKPSLDHDLVDELLHQLRHHSYHMYALRTDFLSPLERAELSFIKIEPPFLV
jgi:Methyltransferase domain